MQLEAQPCLRISPRTAHQGTERNKNRAIPWPDGIFSGLFSFGDDWHRSLPQEAARVLCVDFFFSIFIVQLE